jgi:AcrR family transcriptional regulator
MEPMTPPPTTQSTSKRLLLAAQELFLERNYADVTMDQICSATEVTKGALYHHFSGKEELYLAMLHQDLAAKRELFAQAVAMEGSCKQRLHKLTGDFLGLPAVNRGLITLVRRDINIFPQEVRAELVRLYQSALPEQVQAILEDGMAAGEIVRTDSRLRSWEFVALVEVTLSPYAEQVLPTVESKLNHVLDVFFQGAMAPNSNNLS